MRVVFLLLSLLMTFNLVGCNTLKSLNLFSSSASSEETKTGNTTPSPSAQGTVVASQSPPVSANYATRVSLTWVGVEKDMVSPSELKPDKKTDGNFHATITFSEPAAIKSIWIRYEEFGKSLKWGGIYNQNLPVAGYVMAIVDSRKNQLLPQGDNGYQVEGTVDLDLYLSELTNEKGRDSHKFVKDQLYTMEIAYVTKNHVEKEVLASVKIP